jgi:hypothetical protein
MRRFASAAAVLAGTASAQQCLEKYNCVFHHDINGASSPPSASRALPGVTSRELVAAASVGLRAVGARFVRFDCVASAAAGGHAGG